MRWFARDRWHWEREDGKWSILPCAPEKFLLCCLTDRRPIVSGLESQEACVAEAKRQDEQDAAKAGAT